MSAPAFLLSLCIYLRSRSGPRPGRVYWVVVYILYALANFLVRKICPTPWDNLRRCVQGHAMKHFKPETTTGNVLLCVLATPSVTFFTSTFLQSTC